MAEAGRQETVARQLYKRTGQLYDRKGKKIPWEKVPLEKRRPYVDRSCHPPFIEY
jgi:hypothetical protein